MGPSQIGGLPFGFPSTNIQSSARGSHTDQLLLSNADFGSAPRTALLVLIRGGSSSGKEFIKFGGVPWQ